MEEHQWWRARGRGYCLDQNVAGKSMQAKFDQERYICCNYLLPQLGRQSKMLATHTRNYEVVAWSQMIDLFYWGMRVSVRRGLCARSRNAPKWSASGITWKYAVIKTAQLNIVLLADVLWTKTHSFPFEKYCTYENDGAPIAFTNRTWRPSWAFISSCW